jgi:hypothetical protein
MEKNITQKIGSLIIFLFLGIVSITGSYLIGLKLAGHDDRIEHFLETASTGNFFNAAATSDPLQRQYVFHRGVAQTIERAQFNYRGLEGNNLRMDVIIPELDPYSVYRYSLDIDQAYAGFRLGGLRFKLISAGRTALRLKRVAT